ncbi:hypothetical protein SPBR_05566 [Sporothrix brasiliensis 5110]|uniref:Uncharacterized protein n=1 Tax=Sporothrix brasiliensis 5110 TaxID=1398154 RepID=A0A0C2J593_9PEZI|nr:uncharacterized protein SPBR_05566 [Sporothrix brasiliensis 5110]KIH94140.1 hypothetical protein SPBR_05566 [Sporothrix brasiliensis 5110]
MGMVLGGHHVVLGEALCHSVQERLERLLGETHGRVRQVGRHVLDDKEQRADKVHLDRVDPCLAEVDFREQGMDAEAGTGLEEPLFNVTAVRKGGREVAKELEDMDVALRAEDGSGRLEHNADGTLRSLADFGQHGRERVQQGVGQDVGIDDQGSFARRGVKRCAGLLGVNKGAAHVEHDKVAADVHQERVGLVAQLGNGLGVQKRLEQARQDLLLVALLGNGAVAVDLLKGAQVDVQLARKQVLRLQADKTRQVLGHALVVANADLDLRLNHLQSLLLVVRIRLLGNGALDRLAGHLHDFLKGELDAQVGIEGAVLLGAHEAHVEARHVVNVLLERQGQVVGHVLAVTAAELAEDAHGGVCVEVAVGMRAQLVVEGGHELVEDRCHQWIEVFRCEIIDAELKGTQSLTNHIRASAESGDEGPHQEVEVRQEVAEAGGHRQTELDIQVALDRLAGGQQEVVEDVQQHLEEWQNLLVEVLKLAASDATEERAEQEEVVHGLLGVGRQLDRLADDVDDVGQQNLLVLCSEERDGHKCKLEQAQQDRRLLDVGQADFLDVVHEEAQQHAAKSGRRDVAGQKELRDVQQGRVLEGHGEEMRHLVAKDLVERGRVDDVEDGRKHLEQVLLLLAAGGHVKVGHVLDRGRVVGVGGVLVLDALVVPEDAGALTQQLDNDLDLLGVEAAGDLGPAGGRDGRVDGRCLGAGAELEDGVPQAVHEGLEQELVVHDRVVAPLARVDQLDGHGGGEDVDLVPGGCRGVHVGQVRLGEGRRAEGGGRCSGLALLVGLLAAHVGRQLDGVVVLAVHGGKLVGNRVEDGDEEVAGLDLVVHLGDALGHVQEQLGAHGLEAGAGEVVQQVARVDSDGLADDGRLQVVADVVDQVGQHAVRQRTHGLMHRQAVAHEGTLVEELLNDANKDQAVVEVDDVADGHDELLAGGGLVARAVTQQPDNGGRQRRQEVGHEIGMLAQGIGQETHHLHLERNVVAIARLVADERAHAEEVGTPGIGLGVRAVLGLGVRAEHGLDDRDKRLDVVERAVHLEDADDDDRALGDHLERLHALEQRPVDLERCSSNG